MSAGKGPAGVGGEDLDFGELELTADDVGAEVDGHALVEGDATGQTLAAEAERRRD